MSTTHHAYNGPELAAIDDPEIRRVLRQMHQQMLEGLERQQLEIDAMLELVMEKTGAGLSEYKRHLMRLQQNTARAARIHELIEAATQPPRPVAH